MSSLTRPNLVLSLNQESPTAALAQMGTFLKALVDQVNALRTDLAAIWPGNNTFLLAAPTLVIKAGSSAVVKSSSAIAALVAGSYVTKAADTDMSALAGTLATAKAALWEFYIDSSGTLSTSTKTADAANAAAALALRPTRPSNKLSLGYIIVANASGSNFVGGTTALDATGVTVTYVSADAVLEMTAEAVDSPFE